MSDLHYRIRTEASSNKNMAINVPISGTFDMFEILSLQLSQRNFYKLPKSGYGVLIGRVLANGGFGIPNAKVSVFIPYEGDGTDDDYDIYPYSTVTGINYDRVRYNLLQTDIDDPCHQDVGTFPTKRYMLDNGAVIDVFDKYYKYTTSTNKAGDYMIYGVPVGMNTLHVDIDLSDIGVLSQTPRDMIYKGYNINQFESPTKFRKSENLNTLAQIYSQNKAVYVYPFWGDTTETTTDAAVTRCDIKVDYKFEPTCVFMGSVVTDSGSDGIGKRCTPSKNAGKMSNLRTGEGMIEMIRKTPTGKVESFSVQGNKLIDGDGVWCYQIPMNLDYVMTDEYGNLVPTDDPENGIPTRARVRFRVSMSETGEEGVGYKRARYLIPNNPKLDYDYTDEDIDYEFGTLTKEESYRDLFWNHVYTVKSYIPRLQKSPLPNTKNYTAIKATNHPGNNNPMPYNNIQIKLNFLYRINCMLAFVVISIVTMLNMVLTGIGKVFWLLSGNAFLPNCACDKPGREIKKAILTAIGEMMKALFGWFCTPIYKAIGCGIELRGWCENTDNHFFPGCGMAIPAGVYNANGGESTLNAFNGDFDASFGDSNDSSEQPGQQCTETKCKMKAFTGENGSTSVNGDAYVSAIESALNISGIENEPKKLMECVQSNLAEENEVVSLNFQNDWVNGSVYMPLWGRKIRKRKYNILGYSINRYKDVFCNSLSDTYVNRKIEKNYSFHNRIVSPKNLKLYQTCAIWRDKFFNHSNPQPLYRFEAPKQSVDPLTGIDIFMVIGGNYKEETCFGFNCDKVPDYVNVNAGVITERSTMLGEEVYYYKPSGIKDADHPVRLFATDIVLLGSLDACDESGTPQFFKKLPSSTYKLPPNLVLDEEVNSEADINSSEDSRSRFTVNNIGQKDVKYKTEVTGTDWGKTGDSQQDSATILSFTTPLRAGGLFYGITCNYTSVSPKSCVNLSRICEYGVSLDEAKYIYTSSDSNEQQYLAPDGFISTDEIDDPDGRSMFATLNGNFLKTKESPKTGYLEYDFDFSYQHWFDGSLRDIMKEYQINLYEQYKYKNNYKLEQGSPDYIRFRYGDEIPRSFGTSIKYNGTFIHFGSNFPDYNNSFYFYFGLQEGKTAIDKFRTLYYSECEDDKESDTTNVQFEPNSWCAEATASPDADNNYRRTGDGYILLDLSYVDTPYSLVINSIVDNAYDYTLTNITYPKVYLGPDSMNNFEGYETLKDVNERDICLINGMYEFTVINPDNDETSFNVNFVKETLSFSVDKEDFTISDDIIFNPSNGYCVCWNHETESYYCVASYKEGNDRVIGGTVTISGIQNHEGSYRIVLKPQPGYAFNDLPNAQAQDTYTGEILDVINGQPDPNYPEGLHGTILSFDNGEIVIGVPKGNVSYTVNITELCGDNSNILSRNTSSSSVYILSFVLPVMYINGVDSRLIANFGTDWPNSSITPTPPTMINEASVWANESIDNIGGPDVHIIDYNFNPEDPSDYTRPSWNHDVSPVISAISTTINAGSPYQWTEDFVYSEETVKEYYNVYTIESVQTFTDEYGDLYTVDITSLDDEHLSNLNWDEVFGEYNSLSNRWATNIKALNNAEGGLGYKYFTINTSIPSRPFYNIKPVQNVTAREFYLDTSTTDEERASVLDYINTIVTNRLNLPLNVKKAFWVSGLEKDFTITSSSERIPLKYSVFGSKFDDSNPDHITHTFGLLDQNKEENQFACYYPQIVYNENNELDFNKVTTYSLTEDLQETTIPRPYYCATKDSSNITTPHGFGVEEFDLSNTLAGMQPFMFFKRPFKADIVTWSYVSYPSHIGEGYIEKIGVLSADIENGIITSHNPKGNETFFEEQTFNGENVRIATTDTISGEDNIPNEYAYPTKRKLFTTIPMGTENMYTYSFFVVTVYEEGGISLVNYGYQPLSGVKSNLIINDGTYTVSETAYGDFNLVPDYTYETTWGIPLMEHDLVTGDCFVRLQPNQTIENMYDNSCFCVVKHVGSNYPLDNSYSGELFSAYTAETLNERYENGEYLIQDGDVGNIIHYDNTSALHPVGIRSFSDEMQGDGDVALNISTTESFYCFAIAATNNHDFACVYSPLYQMTSVMDMHFNEQEMPGYQVYDGWIYVKIPLTGSYLRTHNSSFEITDTDSGNVLFTKNNITPEEYAMTNPNQPTWKKFKAGNVIPSTTTHVKISVTDVTGLTHSRTLTISGFLG